MALVVISAVACSDADPASSNSDKPSANTSPLRTGTWLLSDVERVPAVGGPCWGTLTQLNIGSREVTIGAQRFECGNVAETSSEIVLAVSGGRLMLGSDDVGSVAADALELILPGGLGNVTIDLAAAAQQFSRSTSGRQHTATMTRMPDARPIALALSVAATEDQIISSRLHAARLPDATVSFAMVAQAPSGSIDSLDADTGEFIYRGAADFFGADSFTFSATDGVLPASEASVSLDVAPVQDSPVATGKTVVVEEDSSVTMTLDAYDVDGDALELFIDTPVEHGTLIGTLPTLTYRPDANYDASDVFRYHVSDGIDSSATVSVAINVTAINDAPVAVAQDLTTRGTNRVRVTLSGTDIEGTALTFTVTNGPTHGTISGSAPDYVYRAEASYVGDESITFTASDGELTSAPQSVVIHVLPPVYSTEILSAGLTSGVRPRLATSAALYFQGKDTAVGEGMWITDGSSAGTTITYDEGSPTARSSTLSLGAASIFELGGLGYYFYPDTLNAVQLRSGTDGSIIASIPNPDAAVYRSKAPDPEAVALHGGLAYGLVSWFSDSGNICEIWATDGTAGGTRLAHSVSTPSVCEGVFEGAGGLHLFVGADLMAFDSVQETPTFVATLPATSAVVWMGTLGADSLFAIRAVTGQWDKVVELWKTDGSTVGTSMLKSVEDSFIVQPVGHSALLGGKAYFSHRGSMWVSDGTVNGSSIIWTAVGAGTISQVTSVGEQLFIVAGTLAIGKEPWVSDGTSEGTALLADIRPGNSYQASTSGVPHRFDGHTFFCADDGVLGPTLWRTDGTPDGTTMVVDMALSQILGVLDGRLIVSGGAGVVAISVP